jgi:hypothetical protein
MAMQSGVRRHSAGAAGIAIFAIGRVPAVLALCLLAAACSSLPPALSSLNPLAGGRDIVVAVESVDGPPREVAQKLISSLNAEGAPLRIGVVTAEAQASYRMRGYLATRATASATAVSWAWDIYDSGLNRAVRLSGEELVVGAKGAPKGAAKGSARGAAVSWAVADEDLIRRIAHAGMDQLAAFMAAPPAAPEPAPAPPPVPGTTPRNGSDTVASNDSVAPEAAGFAGSSTGMARLAEAATRR